MRPEQLPFVGVAAFGEASQRLASVAPTDASQKKSLTRRTPAPRLALMALAIRFDQMIREGVVADQAELTRLGHVSRARLTQIMNLLNLAPDIQKTILSLPRADTGRDPVTERDLRPIAAVPVWRSQRRMWRVRTS